MKEDTPPRTKVRLVVAGIVILALVASCILVGCSYGQHRVRSRYEIWWSASGGFERESVRAAKMAVILADYQRLRTTNSGEVLILGELRSSLSAVESLVALASDPDRKIASRLAQSITDQIAPFAPTNSTYSTYRESHRASLYREIQEALDSISQKSTNGTAKL